MDKKIKKKIYTAVIFALLIFLFLSLHKISRLNSKIKDLKTEISSSSKYISTLKEQLLKNNPKNTTYYDKDEYLKKLLQDYLSENKDNPQNKILDGDKLNKFIKKTKIIPDILPVKGSFEISQKFSKEHQAVDFAAPLGTEVMATAYGEIISVKYDKYFGNIIEIDHFNGYCTRYAHLAKILVEKGDLIKKEQAIGLVGDTGNSTSPHLHYEIIKDGKNIDPLTIIKTEN